jgi:hypothetical protein
MSPNHKILLEIYKSVGELYIRQDEWIKGIDYYQKAVRIFLEYNDSDVVGFYNIIPMSFGLLIIMKQLLDMSNWHSMLVAECCQQTISISERLQNINVILGYYCTELIRIPSSEEVVIKQSEPLKTPTYPCSSCNVQFFLSFLEKGRRKLILHPYLYGM